MQEILLHLEKILTISPYLGLGACFAAGFLVSFSPCVYPLIPVTISIVGAHSAVSKTKGFILSLVFVLGIAVTYTTLGVAAGLAGKIFSSFYVNPWTYGILAIIFIVLGLIYMDLLKIRISFAVPQYRSAGGLLSLFILGVISGLAVIPCNFPVLGSILSFISVKGQIWYGALGLFLFSLGYGVLLLLIGISSSLLTKLPKQGPWLVIIKRLLGAILVLTGIMFVFKVLTVLGI